MSNQRKYQTRQGRTVLECLKTLRGHHVTVDDLVDALKEQASPVGKTTVYRHLEKLIADGSVRKFNFDDGPACYQYVDTQHGCDSHFHLVCETCGALIHLECDHFGEMLSHLETEHHFQINHCKTVLYGQCARCGGKAE